MGWAVLGLEKKEKENGVLGGLEGLGCWVKKKKEEKKKRMGLGLNGL